MTPDQWESLGKYIGLIALGAFGAYKGHRAEQQAKKAKELSSPTGNGFAQTVKDALNCLQNSAAEQKQATERIELSQSKDAAMLYDHIRAHANADVLKGARNDSPSSPDAS